jgi:tetratricopeptide (TPR) repeat protein
MFTASLRICEEHAADMPDLLADAVFCVGSYASDTNQFPSHLKYALRHFDLRMALEEGKLERGRDSGMAHSEMGLAYLLNGQYEKSIEHSIISRQIYEKIPDFLNGSYWPFFAIIHHAQSLLGLDREEEAVDMLLETLRWREAKYGPGDTESFKYAAAYCYELFALRSQPAGWVTLYKC